MSGLIATARLAQKHFREHSALLTTHCLAYGESLSLCGYVAHRSCYTVWWTLASVPGGVGLAALHFCVHVLIVMWDVPVTVTPHWKLLPSRDACWESGQFFPVPVQTPTFPWKMSSTIPNCSHKDLSKLAEDTLVAAGGHSWSLMVKGVYPVKQKAMTLCTMKRKGCVGETSSKRKWNEMRIRGRKFLGKNGSLKMYKQYLEKQKQDLNRWLADRKALKS